MDKIIIRQLKLETIIGLFPWERVVRQTLLIDLDIAVDTAKAAATDDVACTTNYVEVCDRVVALADAGQFKLIETLAVKITELLFDEFAATWVKVSVAKVDSLPQVASVGVCVERHKERD